MTRKAGDHLQGDLPAAYRPSWWDLSRLQRNESVLSEPRSQQCQLPVDCTSSGAAFQARDGLRRTAGGRVEVTSRQNISREFFLIRSFDKGRLGGEVIQRIQW